MKIYQTRPILPVNDRKPVQYQQIHHTQPMAYDSFSCSKNQIISFKRTFGLKTIKNIFKPDDPLDKLPENEPVDKETAEKILHKKLKDAPPLNSNLHRDEIMEICEFKGKKPLTPQYLDVIAKLLILYDYCTTTCTVKELFHQADIFYDKRGNFLKESFEKYIKESSDNNYLTHIYGCDYKMSELLEAAKEKDGSINHGVLDLIKYAYLADPRVYGEHFKVHGKINPLMVETAAYILKDAKKRNTGEKETTDSIVKILSVCKSVKGNPDLNAIDFAKKIPKISKEKYSSEFCTFVNLSSNSDTGYNPEFEKYFDTYMKTANLVRNRILNNNAQFDIEKLDDLKKTVDFALEVEPNYSELDFSKFIEMNYDKSENINKKTTDAYLYLHKNYGKYIKDGKVLNKFNKIIGACQNRDLTLNEEVFKLVDRINLELFDCLTDENVSESDFSRFCNLVSMLNNKDNTADKKLFSKLKQYTDSPYYPQIIDLTLMFKSFRNVAEYFDVIIDIHNDLKNIINEKQGIHASISEDDIYYVSQLAFKYTHNENSYKEIFAINQSYLKSLKTFMKEYDFEEAYWLAREFPNNDLRYQDFKKLLETANANKQTLREGTEDLTDREITSVFAHKAAEIMNVNDFIGEKAFKYAFKLKFDKFQDFVTSVDEMIDKYSQNSEKIKIIINPAGSERYKTLQKTLKEQKSSLAAQKPPELLKVEAENNKLIENLKNEITKLKQNFTESVEKNEKEQIKTLINEKSAQIKKLRYHVLKMYFENDFEPELKKIKETQNEMNLILKNSLSDYEEIINHLLVLSSLKESLDQQELDFYLEMMSRKDSESKNELKEFLNRKIFKNFDIEYDKNLSERLNLSSSKYLPNLLYEHGSDFDDYFTKICAILKKNPNKSIPEIFNRLKQNIETKNQFKKLGIDYDTWVNVDKNSFVPVEVTIDIEKAKQAAIRNIEADLNDECLQKIPENETRKIFRAIENKGFELKLNKEVQYDADGSNIGLKEAKRIFKDGNPLLFEDAGKVISAIKEVFNKENFWNQKHENETVEAAKDTILTHILKLRENEFKNAQNLKNAETVRLEVRKTDMNNISHALFLGNHASCCTAVGTGCNEWSAPAYILNKCISSIEVADGNNFVGNTMCYIAKVDGTPSLVLDNIELNTKYQYNDKIRDAILDYAKKLTKELGKPNMPIYAGPYRHKVNLENFPFEKHKIQIVGSTGKNEVYIDYLSEGVTIDGTTDEADLYKIK